MSAYPDDEPWSTLTDMLLCEPGSRIEGQTQDVLAIIFATTYELLSEDMPQDSADRLSLRILPRVHEALTHAGHVVRHYPATDPR